MDFWILGAGKLRLERFKKNTIRDVMRIKHFVVDDIRTKQLI